MMVILLMYHAGMNNPTRRRTLELRLLVMHIMIYFVNFQDYNYDNSASNTAAISSNDDEILSISNDLADNAAALRLRHHVSEGAYFIFHYYI